MNYSEFKTLINGGIEMVEKNFLMRGLDEKHLMQLKNSCWFKFYKQHQDELFLGIRNNYVNIYYKGMNIAKIEGSFNKATISSRYIYKNFKGKSEYQTISFDEFKEKYKSVIKQEVEKHIEKNQLWEKSTQQSLILKNNQNKNSNWICIDMEYSKQRKNNNSNNGKSFGRVDIIAVNKKNFEVALIELKVGKNAIGGNSGLLKHARDWNHDYIENDLFNQDIDGGSNCLKKEIVRIINNKIKLENDFPIKNCSIKDFKNIKPSFYFLICSGNNLTLNEVKNEVRKYLWLEDKCKNYNIKKVSEKYNVEGDLYDITTKKEGKLYCEFLFIDGQEDNIRISDIIDDENYDRKI